jgi:DNA-binding IscR family transcriptional regulator
LPNGPNGGFYISAKQKNQQIIYIIEAVDGKQVFNQCGLGLGKCSSSHPCSIHDDYKVVKNGFEKICTNRKVSDLCEPVTGGLVYLFG